MDKIPADPSALSPSTLKRTLGLFGMKGGSKSYMIKALLDLRMSLARLATLECRPVPANAVSVEPDELDLVPDYESVMCASSPDVRRKFKRDKSASSPTGSSFQPGASTGCQNDLVSRIRSDSYLYQRMLLMQTLELGEVHDALQVTRSPECGGAYACSKRLLREFFSDQGVSVQLAWRQ
jgi:hypothetical protein